MTLSRFLHDLAAVLWGATWGNNMAAVEWTTVLTVAGWLGRHHIGRVLAAWWALHHGPHAAAQHQKAVGEIAALVEGLRSEVEALRALVEAQGRDGQ